MEAVVADNLSPANYCGTALVIFIRKEKSSLKTYKKFGYEF